MGGVELLGSPTRGAETRASSWQRAFGRAYASCRTTAPAGPTPAEHLRRVPLDDLALLDLACGPMTVERSRRQMSSTDPDSFALLVPRAGAERVRTDAGESVLQRGVLALWHLDQPAGFSTGYVRKLSLVVPSATTTLGRELRTRPRMLASTAPAARVLVGYLEVLTGAAQDLDARARTAARNATVELLEALLRGVDHAPAAGRPLGMAMSDWVDRHLPDGDLSPEAVAAAHGVSVRTLHRAFATLDQTFAGTVRGRRLERARQDLLRHGATVTEVAHRWGFADGSHFTRLFRERYGQTPREMRHEHAADLPRPRPA